MVLRNLAAALLVGGALALSACSDKASTVNPVNSDANAAPETAKRIDPGAELFEYATFADRPARPVIEPLVIPNCHLSVLEKQDLPSQIEGYVDELITEVRPNDQVSPDELIKPELLPDVLLKTGKQYRRLRRNDMVHEGELVVLLDRRQIKAELQTMRAAVEASIEEEKGAEQLVEASIYLFELQDKLQKKGSGAQLDWVTAKANVARYTADLASKKASTVKTRGELIKTEVKLEMHEIRAKISGIVKEFYKPRGEAVKQADPILQIYRMDKLRVEGFVGREFRPDLAPGTPIQIEIPRPAKPINDHEFHKQAITAVAVSSNANPYILAASEDRTVTVSLRSKETKLVLQKTWVHDSPVRALAVTLPGSAKNIALTGADDGRIRMYDLDKLEDKPIAVLEGQHNGAVQCIAISPPNKSKRTFAVTADDKEVFLWDLDKKTKLYSFPAEHRGAITALHFLPQGFVVSCSKDNAARLWQVGEKGAALERELDKRSGEVGILGVSSDGRKFLFDHDKSRLHILTAPKGDTETIITNAAEGSQFSTFALFSPNDDFILTSGAASGTMQLWRLDPQQNRGAELWRLTPPFPGTPTTAAFAPIKQGGFFVVGMASGEVYLWNMPTEADLASFRRPGVIDSVDSSVDSSGKQVRVFAKVDNPTVKRKIKVTKQIDGKDVEVEQEISDYELTIGSGATIVVPNARQ